MVRTTMRAAAAALLIAFGPETATAEINGAGSTFAHPLMSRWAEAYKAETGEVVKYQSVGSGAGIKQIERRAVDFGASDMPLKPAELEQMDLIQFPVMIGGVVPVLNVGAIAPGELKLDAATLVSIFMGRITKWNAPAIAILNPAAKLPDLPIVVVFRSDGSGTTFILTEYLSKMSPEWRERVGAGTTVKFPTGVGRNGNDGVAQTIGRTAGSIGYVEYTYAKRSSLSYARVRNSAGEYVLPTAASFQAAAASADWSKAPGYYLVLTDQPGAQTWPIAGSVFILMGRSRADRERIPAALRFFDWAYRKGGGLADKLDYVTIPTDVQRQIQESWRGIKTADGQPAWGARP